MQKGNQMNFTEFLLLGFEKRHNLNIILFFIFLHVYIMTLSGNILIIALVSSSHHLSSPMYFFLKHLSLCDILLTTNIAPNMLQVILKDGSTISFTSCITQLYFFAVSETAECLLLTVMSYDRYLAICNPLYYTSIMDLKLRLHLVVWSWFISFMISLITVILIDTLQFCNSNVIDHFFCDLAPILELSCSDSSFVESTVFVLSTPVILLPFVFITATYIYIILAILRIHSSTGRQKAFSTCSSHLTLVSIFYGTLISLYMTPSRGHSLKVNKALSLLYTVVTPLLNPIIYSLRNQEIRSAFRKVMLF
ncbi:olfactory receptor 11L1-like [Ascaphus truei]|uniref:olfactory receptor 11L1-like n=1 Tax=Ascaphus truei TaxID=8439 RepID=UPI003F5A0E22